jgi:hypothetical protein
MRLTAALLVAAIGVGMPLVPAFSQTTVDVVQQTGPSAAFVLATGPRDSEGRRVGRAGAHECFLFPRAL